MFSLCNMFQGSMGRVNQYKSSFLRILLLDFTGHTYSKLSFDMTFHNPSNNFVTWPSMYITWNMVERKKNENKWFAQPLETSLIVKARGKVVRLEVKNIKEFLSLSPPQWSKIDNSIWKLYRENNFVMYMVSIDMFKDW